MNRKLTTSAFLGFIWGTEVHPSHGYILAQPPKPDDPSEKINWKTTTLKTDALAVSDALVVGFNDNRNIVGTFYMPAILSEPRRNGRLIRTSNAANNKHKRGFRALFLDLDCGPKKKYATQTDALKALPQFLKATGLPSCNIVVNSGSGLHVYWVADRIFSLDEWLPMATVLKALCKEHALHADPTVTADISRILRLPESFNRKDINNPKKCTARQVGALIPAERLLSALKGEPTQAPLTISSALSGETSDDLRGNVGGKPAFMKQVVKRCQYFAHVAANGGADCDEPMWMQVMNICTFAEDGEEWAHILSRGHADYNEAATTEKYQNRIKARTNDPKLSASRCETLEAGDTTGCNLCDGCEFKGKIKSPIQLGRGVVEATVAKQDDDDLHLPNGYTRNAAGHVWKATVKPDGTPGGKQIAVGVAILGLTIAYTTVDGKECMVTLHYATDRPRLLSLMASEYQAPTLGVALAMQGLDMQTKGGLGAFKEFIVSWITKLKTAGVVTQGAARFGWMDHYEAGTTEFASFSLGSTAYGRDGSESPGSAESITNDQTYNVRGSQDAWNASVKLLTAAHQPELMSILAASFASPLLKLSGITGAGISVYSSLSGVGKTSALRVAQAVWGDPTTGVTSMNDTPTSIIAKAGNLNNLPLFWDEVRTDAVMENLGGILFAIIQGRDKARCDQTGKRRQVTPFNTLLVTTSNSSLVSVLEEAAGASAAGNARMLEMFIEKEAKAPVGGDAVFGALDQNHGHAGVVYAKFIAQNQNNIRAAMAKLTDNVRTKTGAKNEERFWVHTIAALLLGASLAKKLGLVDFDLPALQKFYFSLLTRTRVDAEDYKDTTTARNTLRTVLYELTPRTLTSDVFRAAGGSGVGSVSTILSLPRDSMNPVAVHVEESTGTIRIVKSALQDEMRRQRGRYKYTSRELATALKRENLKAISVQRYFPEVHNGRTTYKRHMVLEVVLAGDTFEQLDSPTKKESKDVG